MANPQRILKLIPEKRESLSEQSSLMLEQRVSRDLVIALMGPVGSGLLAVATRLDDKLCNLGYKVFKIKISEFIKERIASNSVDVSEESRYLVYQTAGNELRKEYKTEVLAEYAINKIDRFRLSYESDSEKYGEKRFAFIIDQIKHPDEIKLLRLVYRKNLYILGVMSLQEQREARLLEEGAKLDDINAIISRDKKEPDEWGQHLEKAFKMADYFLQHPFGKPAALEKQIARFVDLIHGSNSITPTSHEHAMYVAFSAAAKSACLSRQVGACITDKYGRVIAIGANDVPSPGGGLYYANGKMDNRCYKKGICENDKQKDERLNSMDDAIKNELLSLSSEVSEEIKNKIKDERWVEKLSNAAKVSSGIRDLIEFSRAVHAEMDALVSLSRSGGGMSQDGLLYTTTFPCHNCARHIIAAGIKKVYYIEPYAKSLAISSHQDAINVVDFEDDEIEHDSHSTKVEFIHFSGVAPRAFNDLFSRDSGRKDSTGRFKDYVDILNEVPEKVSKEYRDSYLDFETKIATMFDAKFNKS
ncbi:hypothetical protein DK842_08585 [Chromobacterium phragmitis]|uniref:anti-phage dCTP deaminase n=1 Tax=Chromobacterium phragmitis TaxID=2202141 RepID=UPI000DEC5817|nr:anti-phage dCTP deaminase [Chromobacterium phragmitis]AXE29942.1 hypothetical protein DK842_08585 [Chromobacterium phragmitis]